MLALLSPAPFASTPPRCARQTFSKRTPLTCKHSSSALDGPAAGRQAQGSSACLPRFHSPSRRFKRPQCMERCQRCPGCVSKLVCMPACWSELAARSPHLEPAGVSKPACPAAGRRTNSPASPLRVARWSWGGRGHMAAPGRLPRNTRPPTSMPTTGEAPRALCLAAADRDVIVRRLGAAVISFQQAFLSREQSPAGLLCQVRQRRGGGRKGRALLAVSGACRPCRQPIGGW